MPKHRNRGSLTPERARALRGPMVARACAFCRAVVEMDRQQRYCSAACRLRAWREGR